MATRSHDEKFYAEQKQRLEKMRDELLATVDIETDEFNRLFTELSTKDSGEIAKELEDHTALGMMSTIDRERLRKMSSALYKLDHDTYGECTSCGATISRERLEAMPTASMCISCKSRQEKEQRQR
jgi:DnaK suppressor protein